MVKEVVLEFNKRIPASVFSLNHIRQIARRTREAVQLRNLAALADCLNTSWAANKRIHPGATSEEIELLLQKTKNHWTGAKLLGSGGGGYMLFISENESQGDKLKEVLQKKFENERARLADFRLNETGLKIGVS
jgi:galactokinase/mevalonate kinase-like predicted kinase